MTVKEMTKIVKLLHPVREKGYVQFDYPRIDVWEKMLKSLGFTPEQISKFYED